MSHSTDHLTAILGLLYMTFHAEEDLNERDGQLEAIGKHLTLHTYRFRSTRTGMRSAYDLHKFRGLAGDIARRRYRTSKSVDQSTLFFRLKNEGGLKEIYDHYGFDQETFSSTNLPPASYSEEEKQHLEQQLVNGFGTAKPERQGQLQRSTYLILTDIEAVKHKCTDPEYK